MSSQVTKLVYFYSDDDRNLVRDMKINLSVLQTLGYVELWSKQSIRDGELDAQVISAIREAKIIIYFLSPSFISTEYENLSNLRIEDEAARDWIFRRQSEGHLLFIPILLNNIPGFQRFRESKLTVLKDSSLGSLEKSARNDACVKIGETIIEYVEKIRGGITDQPAPIRRKMPPFPSSLLPQLCARNEQSEELQKKFNEHRSFVLQDAPKRPLVCIIHGDIEECLEGYKERLEKREIYEFLQLDYEYPIKFFNLGFPYESYDVAQPKTFFDRTLKERFFDGIDDKSEDKLINFLNQFRTVVINYDVFSENWNRRVIDSFLEFWNTLPIQNSRATIIVNLFFSYDENSSWDKKSNLEARGFFTDLKQNQLANYPNIDVMVTSELDAIERIEVINWLNNPKVFRDFCSDHTPDFCDRSTVQGEINDLYRQRGTPRRFTREVRIEIDGIPETREITLIRMRTLSEKLGNLLVTVKKRAHSRKF